MFQVNYHARCYHLSPLTAISVMYNVTKTQVIYPTFDIVLLLRNTIFWFESRAIWVPLEYLKAQCLDLSIIQAQCLSYHCYNDDTQLYCLFKQCRSKFYSTCTSQLEKWENPWKNPIKNIMFNTIIYCLLSISLSVSLCLSYTHTLTGSKGFMERNGQHFCGTGGHAGNRGHHQRMHPVTKV